MSGKIPDSSNRFALDVKSTAELREQLKKDPRGGLHAAAQQFEAMFLQMVLKSMRDATPQDDLLASDQSRFYTSMLDQQLAQNMANGQGVGFARLIEEQLGRSLQGDAATAPNAAGAEAAANVPPAIRAGNPLPLSASDQRHLQALQAYRSQSAAAGAAGEAATAPAADSGAAAPTAKDFVGQVWPHAVEASRATGIPPQFLVAQAALESGWGKGEIRRADGSSSHNLFGIKAGKNWTGSVVEAPTTEYVNGQAQRVTEKFRAYGSYAEAFRDYASLLRNNPRYGNVVGSQDGTEFAKRLQQAGYATDPGYAEKLARIINGPVLRQALIG